MEGLRSPRRMDQEGTPVGVARRNLADFLALRRNTAWPLVALVLAGMEERLWLLSGEARPELLARKGLGVHAAWRPKRDDLTVSTDQVRLDLRRHDAALLSTTQLTWIARQAKIGVGKRHDHG